MLGSYRADDRGFPLREYWKDDEEYALNRKLWEKKGEAGYDIIRETLDYCAMDVLVTAELVAKLQDSYAHFIRDSVRLPHAHFNIFQRPTISSNSHAIFRQIVFRAEQPQRTNLGPAFLAPSHELYDYVRASIRGGAVIPPTSASSRSPSMSTTSAACMPPRSRIPCPGVRPSTPTSERWPPASGRWPWMMHPQK